MRLLSVTFITSVLFLSLFGCSPVSQFNQVAYDRAVSIKTTALNLISKSNETYSGHRAEIDSLKFDVEQAYQYSKTIPYNDETTAQWEIIRDPQRSSLFGLLERWKNKDTLSNEFISQVKILIAFDFNLIIDLENNKKKLPPPSTGLLNSTTRPNIAIPLHCLTCVTASLSTGQQYLAARPYITVPIQRLTCVTASPSTGQQYLAARPYITVPLQHLTCVTASPSTGQQYLAAQPNITVPIHKTLPLDLLRDRQAVS
ncbi:MAG: hypothetical protein P4L69_11240 [Desulfosporosinus sp.]|nr:hypothetical protein [Desulfosporosinus sp.]